MTDFDLDLGAIEEDLEAGEDRSDGHVVLDVLDGETPPEEWLDLVEAGNVLVLSVDGPLEELAADFAPDIDQAGGSIVHFRDFLIAVPPTVTIDTDRL
jgi:hypothetical protein